MPDPKTDEFLDSVKRNQRKMTWEIYRYGLKHFLRWLGKTGTEVLEDHKRKVQSEDQQERDFYSTKLNDYYSSMLKEGLTQNTARTKVTGAVQFFSYYGFTMKIKKAVWKVQITASDFVPTIQQYRDMFNCGDIRERTLVSLALDLALRVGDFISIKKSELPDLAQETPIAFERMTQKENVLAHGFISAESVELLKTYLPTLKPENPYLFQSNHESHIEDQTANDILKNLAEKAKLKIPSGKKLRFHAFRKRFLSTCADLRVDLNVSKGLTGKQIPKDMESYLSEVSFRDAFLMVKSKLSLMNGTVKASMDSKDAQIMKLQAQLTEQELLLKAMTSLFGNEILTKAREQQAAMLGDKGNLLKDLPSKLSPLETLRAIGREIQIQEQAAYQKMIAENGNGNH
jgi:integrase